MRSITIHGLEDPLDSLIEERARKQGTSLNKTIKQLLAESLGVSEKPTHHNRDFEDLFGIWTAEDLEEFSQKNEGFSTIDPKDWD